MSREREPRWESLSVIELEARLADVRARLPKHTPPPSMLIEIEEIEEALERALAEQERAGVTTSPA
jgi:hypothetical protein